MEFFQHTLQWIKGEIIEASVVLFSGILMIVSSGLLYKFNNTLHGKSLIIPLAVIGLLLATSGIFGIINNNKRISTYTKAYNQNEKEFLLSEKTRVENFDTIFKYTYPISAILVIAGAILFFTTKNTNLKAVYLGFITIGFAAYYIDYFAFERAKIYLNHIKNHMN